MSEYEESHDIIESSDLPSEPPQDASYSPMIRRTRPFMDVASSDIPSTPPEPSGSDSVPLPPNYPRKRRMSGRDPPEGQGRGAIDDTLEIIELADSGGMDSSPPKRQRTSDPSDTSEKPELILKHAEPNFRAGPVFHYPPLYREIEHAKNRGLDVGPSGGVVIRYEPYEGRGVTPPPVAENWRDSMPHLYSTFKDIEDIQQSSSMEGPEESESEVQAVGATDQPVSSSEAPPAETQDVEMMDVAPPIDVHPTQKQTVQTADQPGRGRLTEVAEAQKQDFGAPGQPVVGTDQPFHPTTVLQTEQQVVGVADQPAPRTGIPRTQGQVVSTAHPEQPNVGAAAGGPPVATGHPVPQMGDTTTTGDGAQAQAQRVGYTPAQPPYSPLTQYEATSEAERAPPNTRRQGVKAETLTQQLRDEIAVFATSNKLPMTESPPPLKELKKGEVDIKRIGKKRLKKALRYMGPFRRMRTWSGPPEMASIHRRSDVNLSVLPPHPGFSRPARRDKSSISHKTQEAVKIESGNPRNVPLESVGEQVQESPPARRSTRATAGRKGQTETTTTAAPTSSVTQVEPSTQRPSGQPSVAPTVELRRSTRKTSAQAQSRASSVASTHSETTKKSTKKATSKAPKKLKVVVEEEEEEEEGEGERVEGAESEEEASDAPPVTTKKGKGKAGAKGAAATKKGAASRKTGTTQKSPTAAKGSAKGKTTAKTTKASTAKKGAKKTTAKKTTAKKS